MFIILLTYQKSIDEVNSHLQAHRAFLERHYANGTFLLSGPREPREGGFILARSPSMQKVQQILADDPFNVWGIATYEVLQVLPTKSSPELGALVPTLNS